MKSMTCKELGGACDKTFTASTFGEIAEMSQKHGAEMFRKGDEAHMIAMEKMKELMNNPAAMQQWFDEKRRVFDNLPDA